MNDTPREIETAVQVDGKPIMVAVGADGDLCLRRKGGRRRFHIPVDHLYRFLADRAALGLAGTGQPLGRTRRGAVVPLDEAGNGGLAMPPAPLAAGVGQEARGQAWGWRVWVDAEPFPTVACGLARSEQAAREKAATWIATHRGKLRFLGEAVPEA